jgi:Ca-activated chloride channel family protein
LIHFLAPAAFALAALLPVIVAMYLLRLRRTERVVSSTYLWQRMVRDVEANAPWQRLRHNLLLYLQLLILALLIFALARPFAWAEGRSGQATILVLDTSASMSATDASPTRLDAARAQARQIVDGLPDDARVTVIVAGQQARVLLSSSTDRRQAHLAIDQVRPEVGGSDMAAAIELASAVAARRPDTEIIVLSDGRVELPQRLAMHGNVRYLPLGTSGDNQAVGALSVRSMPGGQYLTAFVQVTNYGESSVQRRLALYADGQLANAYDLDLPAGGQRAVVAEQLPPETEVIEAQLLGADVLSLDDRAWAVTRAGARASVVLVSEGNRFLETALGLMPDLALTVVSPAQLPAVTGSAQGPGPDDTPAAATAQPIPAGDDATDTAKAIAEALAAADLILLDAQAPSEMALPPSASLLYLAPPRSTAYFSVTGRLDAPVPRLVDPTDPLVAHTAVEQVNILEAARVALPSWARSLLVADLVGAEPTPLLFAGQVAGRRIAVLAFDLRRSDLPLQVSFPLLLANLVDWLAPGQGAGIPTQVSPGDAVSLSVPPEVDRVEVRTPGGATVRLDPVAGRIVFAETGELGLYELAWGEDGSPPAPRARFAVSLLSSLESDLRPAEDLLLQGAAGEAGEEASLRARREWWRPLAYATVLVLVVEWAVYQRAALARLAGWLRDVLRRRRSALPWS